MQAVNIILPSNESKAIKPSKIVCIGRNFAAHIQELNNTTPSEPVVFVKPNSAISNTLYTHEQTTIHYEAELVFMVENNQFIGVGVGLDLTKREVQQSLKEKGLPWERAKAFDHSAVLSEFVCLQGRDITKLSLRLFINKELKQSGGVDLMLQKPESLLKEVISFMSMQNGDLLMTGTPGGVGPVVLDDEFVAQVLHGDEIITSATWRAVLP